MTTGKKRHGGKRSGAGRKREYADDASRARAWRKRQVRKVENVRDVGQMPPSVYEGKKITPQDEAYARALFHGGNATKEFQDDSADSKKRLGSQLAKITAADREHIGSRSIAQERADLDRSGRIANIEVAEALRGQRYTQASLRQKIAATDEAINAVVASIDLDVRQQTAGLRRIQAALRTRLRKLEREAKRRQLAR